MEFGPGEQLSPRPPSGLASPGGNRGSRCRLAGAERQLAAEAVVKARGNWPDLARDAVVGVRVRVELGERTLQPRVIAVARPDLDSVHVVGVRRSLQRQVRIADGHTRGPEDSEQSDQAEQHKQLRHETFLPLPLVAQSLQCATPRVESQCCESANRQTLADSREPTRTETLTQAPR